MEDLTKDEINAVKYWTLHMGSLNDVFNGEDPVKTPEKAATASDWDIKPMPAENEAIGICFRMTDDEMRVLSMGHIPETMEDHWFAYFDGEWIRLFRSWSGYCIYEGRVTKTDEGFVVDRVVANRDMAQHRNENAESDALLFQALVTDMIGGDPEPLWERYFALDYD